MQAEEGNRIIQIFGENGTNRDQTVINKLNEEHSPPEGAVKLLRFLKDWDQDINHHTNL